MTFSQILVFTIEIIGTIAFSLSGAMVGIEKKCDLFGVLMLGMTTAVCGGLLRDLILGITPPLMFQNPVYVATALIFSALLFFLIKIHKGFFSDKHMNFYRQVLNIFDAVGLGAFTVIGIHTACERGYRENAFLLVAVGMLTGVGGGLLRDVMAMETPSIFVKHIYAVASIAGAVLCVFSMNFFSPETAMVTGALAIIIIRMLSTYFEWNLPKAI